MPAEQPPANILESTAKDVAREVAPDDDLRGIDPISIMTIIISIFQSIVQACPKPTTEIAKDIRRPSLLQRVALRKKAHEMADSNNSAKKIYSAMLNKSSQLSQEEAERLVVQASSDSNLLV